ncbi:chromosomal protein D1-like isoform X2 [Cottoperca gobio]|uniref:Chromosomal protein D1-like isoform X2 n=1 Tax=Cottoperca gobio TaxID=56716 RepID=A0A6J2Q4T1_COTGO|nr:chromosomal protein D1-like isoform X2 [Cottoperca gobio]XP_029292683.1 chromosomal protein D1-like isoform X2 [Cottoperca gobio]XP_029292684.1 chromosomal protein D1-like isoform X2 [Cottoperca gobio]XP_029292685.1 chromosomal protein D1-like isoform X2 [Cottoperca gobio]
MGVLHSTSANLTEVVQADSNSMEEEIRTDETEQGDVSTNEGDSSVGMSDNSPTKRGRGRPQGSKKLKICVRDDVNLMKLVSGISSDGSTQPPRGRGRPKLTKHTEQQVSGHDHADSSVQTPGSKKQASNEDSLTTDHSPKKRGRPRKSLSISTPDTPQARRGRPKGSTKRKSESLASEENEKPWLELSSEDEDDADGSPNSLIRKRGRPRKVVTPGETTQDSSKAVSEKPHRKRGRPRKSIVQVSGDEQELVTDGSQPAKRARGRPKSTFNKKVPGKVGRPNITLLARGKRGRPRKQPAKRGRPRKYPLPPHVDPPEGPPPAAHRSRGRPRKTSPASSSSPHNPEVGSPRKRGRPKGSGNKNKSISDHTPQPFKSKE